VNEEGILEICKTSVSVCRLFGTGTIVCSAGT